MEHTTRKLSRLFRLPSVFFSPLISCVGLAAWFTFLLYGLWWIHNDWPLLAAFYGAIAILGYTDIVLLIAKKGCVEYEEYMKESADRLDRLIVLETNQRRLFSRLHEAEHKIDEMYDDDEEIDSIYG